MSDAKPIHFKPRDGDGPLTFENIVVHRVFETDKDAHTTMHLWVSAEATPTDEAFQTLTVDVSFDLFDGENKLGACRSPALHFETQDKIKVRGDSDLRVDTGADITGVRVRMDIVKIVHATAEVTFEAEPLA